ncbi:hypothetical protein BC828DRAFT_376165 [Blastocladiella britannica]|nr:hypothetical protein BC828DRAFT_376165 [Blastocladiella britannica]
MSAYPNVADQHQQQQHQDHHVAAAAVPADPHHGSPPSPTGNMSSMPKRQPKFYNEISVATADHGIYEGMMTLLGDCVGFFGSIPGLCCFSNPYRVVDQSTVGIISRFGKAMRMVDPGLHRINVVTDTIQSVDIKMQVVPIPPQQVMTRDSTNIIVESVLYYRIVDPYVATFLVSDVQSALVERTQTTLRTIIGGKTLQECIELRETIGNEIEAIIAEPARSWGLEMQDILIKDLKLAQELLESLSAAAKQRRYGEAKVIAAEAEVQAAQLMRKASDVLNTSGAIQIRFMETVKAMAQHSTNKVMYIPLGNDYASAAMKDVRLVTK